MENRAAQIRNLIGIFYQKLLFGHPEESLTLFTGDAEFRVPDKQIGAAGTEQIRDALQRMAAEKALPGRREYHLPHTPALRLSGDGRTADGNWDVHTFLIAGEASAEYVISRLDASFVLSEDGWKICRFCWWTVDSFLPWPYDPREDDSPFPREAARFPLMPAPHTSTEDFYRIGNLIARFAQNNRKYAMEDFFSGSEDVSFRAFPFVPETVRGRKNVEGALRSLDELERRNGGKYIFI